MTAQALLLKSLSVALIGAAILCAVYALFRLRPAAPSLLGFRGERRQRALQKSGLFKSLEPVIRQMGTWVGHLPLTGWRASSERTLAQAGYYLGLTADEFIATTILSVVGYGLTLWLLGAMIGMPGLGLTMGGPLGFMLLNSQVRGERSRRFREVTRSLPVEIDLAAMCMHAGLDFPGAIRLIVQQRKTGDQVLKEELSLVLKELDLGHTRATALSNFAARVPTPAVREFVGAVIQAEEKGTPLADVLKIQATMLRMRRSILAEEAASRAGALMMVPMLMLLTSIFIILMGPLVISSMNSAVMQ
jgi:tight adherence protein C